jgi:hypothetical protein
LISTLLILCCYVPSSRAQVSANLSGTITDESDAVVSAATVRARNIDTGISRTALSDRNGRYQLFALPVGLYEMRITKDGFAEGIRTGIRLDVGQAATVDLGLRIGRVTEQIKVAEDAPVVNLTTQDISGLVGERQVKDLPLNGRSYDLLVTLNPGIVNFTWEKTGGIGVSNSTTGNNFSVSGNRPQQNLFLLNGIEFTGAAENNMQPGGSSQQLLGVDAVREFNVLRDSYGAEYGKRPGGQVAIVSQVAINCTAASTSFCETAHLTLPTISIRAQRLRFSETSLAVLLGDRSAAIRLFCLATTRDCASICIRRRLHSYRTPPRVRRPSPAFSLCSTYGLWLRRELRISMGSHKSSAVPYKRFERILARRVSTRFFLTMIRWPRPTRSTTART